MMRIGIDAKWFFSGTPGIRTHIRDLILNLQEIDKKNEYVIYLDNNSDEAKSFFYNDHFIIKRIYPSFTLPRVLLSFPIVTKAYKLDILWTQMFTPLFLKAKRVITVHDIIFDTHPEYFRKIEHIYFKFIKYSTLLSDVIFTVSKYSKRMLVDRWGIQPEKITVIRNAVGEQYRPITEKLKLNSIRNKYSLPKKFVLYVGRINERKNLNRLIKSFNRLESKDIKLVIVGKPEGKITHACNILNEDHELVIFLGFVPDEDLPIIYNLATFFVYVSIVEGFGIPVLEAMACGCPVIASDTSSMPEIVENAGILVNPFDESGITDALLLMSNDEEKRKELSLKGIERSKMFSWKTEAKKIVKVFESIEKGQINILGQ
jgi:glycosyltransferase involved in cell wall biosynthesis